MKRYHLHPSLLFISLAILLALTSCDESVRMIEPDDDSQQTIIIGDEDEQYDTYNGNAQGYALIYIFNRQEERISWPELPPLSKGCGQIDVVKRSSEPRDTLTTVDLGTVQLGSFVFERERANGIILLDTVTIIPEWEFVLHFTIDPHNRDPIPSLTGKIPFLICNSPDIRDLSIELDIPERNVITNILLGQEIDPNQDLIVQAKSPMVSVYPTLDYGHFSLWAWKCEEDEYGVDLHGTGTNFLLTEESDTIVIPSEELFALIQDHSNADFFTISLFQIRNIAEVPLYDHDGNLYQTLKVNFIDRHRVEISFKK